MTEHEHALVSSTSRETSGKKLKNYKSRFNLAIEDVFVDNAFETKKLTKSLNRLFEKNTSKYDRAVAALQIIKTAMPKSIRKNIAGIYKVTHMKIPVSAKDYIISEKIGRGGINSVYLLESQKPEKNSYVLKINHVSYEERNLSQQVKIANEQKNEYERISGVYKNIKDLIPAEHYMIIHGRRNNQPVVTMIQELEGELIRDAFTDFEPEELKTLLEKNTLLRYQLKQFIEATKSDPELLKNELDLLGRKNLAIIGEKGEERLKLLDPHFRSSISRSPEMQEEIKQRFSYLADLSEAVS
jgi:hypothetical protein